MTLLMYGEPGEAPVDLDAVVDPTTGITATQVGVLCEYAVRHLGGEIAMGHEGMTVTQTDKLIGGNVRRLLGMVAAGHTDWPADMAEEKAAWSALVSSAQIAVRSNRLAFFAGCALAVLLIAEREQRGTLERRSSTASLRQKSWKTKTR